MLYAMLLKAHSNVRYEQSLQKLALKELGCAMHALRLNSSSFIQTVAGESFLCFEHDELTGEEWAVVSEHSGICLAGELTGDSLRLIELKRRVYLPDELPKVLKYKGKTNSDFTSLLINCALGASDFIRSDKPITVLDPLCGKGTTLFSALGCGFNAVGVERDAKALAEANAYLERFLKLNKLKHKRRELSQTLKGGGSAKAVSFEVSCDVQGWREGDSRSLIAYCADAARLSELVKPQSCHIVAADLPYGVQHAPGEGGRMSTLSRLTEALARGCYYALVKGGAAAFAFNSYTLKRDEVTAALNGAGFNVMREPPFDDFSHWVEQAVMRDVVIARKEA